MDGLKPAVIGMIGASVVSVGQSALFTEGVSLSAMTSYSFITSAVIFILMMVLEFKNLHPIIIILISAALGIIAGCIEPII